jgi:hypothetical protein
MNLVGRATIQAYTITDPMRFLKMRATDSGPKGQPFEFSDDPIHVNVPNHRQHHPSGTQQSVPVMPGQLPGTEMFKGFPGADDRSCQGMVSPCRLENGLSDPLGGIIPDQFELGQGHLFFQIDILVIKGRFEDRISEDPQRLGKRIRGRLNRQTHGLAGGPGIDVPTQQVQKLGEVLSITSTTPSQGQMFNQMGRPSQRRRVMCRPVSEPHTEGDGSPLRSAVHKHRIKIDGPHGRGG